MYLNDRVIAKYGWL